MAAKKLLRYLAYAVGAMLVLLVAVAVIGLILGQRAPERVSFAWVAHFEDPPDQIWRVLELPARRTEVRERADGTRYEAAPGDQSGALILLYEPTARIVHHFEGRNSETWSVLTLTPERGGTLVRIEDSGRLVKPWHRLLVTPHLKTQGRDMLRGYANALGQPNVEIRATVSSGQPPPFEH